MTSSRTPENALKFINLLASQNKVLVRPMSATTEYVGWDVSCGGGECFLAAPKTSVVDAIQDVSTFQFGDLAACKSTLSIENKSKEYVDNVLETRGESWVHTMAYRSYTITVPGPITRNHWIKAVRELENLEFDWAGVRRITPTGGQYAYTLIVANDRAPGGGIRLFFGDDSELRNRAHLALEVVVKSCDPLADSGF